MKKTKFLLPILLLLFFAIHYLSGQRYISDCTSYWVKKGDTIDFDFYNRYPEDNIEIEWRKNHRRNNITNVVFCYAKVFKIKNNFSHDIYLEAVRTGAGYCVPSCFYSGLLKPDSTRYTIIEFDLTAKASIGRGIIFHFIFCPNTPEAEPYKVSYFFEGTKK